MTDALPADIRVEQTARGVRYVLPRRRGKAVGCAGISSIVFGSIFGGFSIVWMAGALGSMWGPNGQFQWSGILFTLFGLPFVAAGLSIIGFGLAMLLGQSRIETRDEMIRAGEGIGPLVIWRNRPLSALRRFTLDAMKSRSSGQRQWKTHAGAAAIRAEFDGRKPLIIAPGYPREWLLALSETLATQIERSHPGALFNRDEPGIEIVNETDDEVDEDRRRSAPAERPVNTEVRIEALPDGVSLTIPPAGIWRGSKGLFFFGLLWCGFMVVFSSFTVIVPLFSGQIGAMIPFALFSLLFWAIGIALLLGAINMGRRHAILDVVGDTLLVNRRNIFGLKQHEWRRDEIRKINTGPSGMASNDVPIINLQIHLKNSETIGLFAGREEDELAWIAWVLEDALGLHDLPKSGTF